MEALQQIITHMVESLSDVYKNRSQISELRDSLIEDWTEKTIRTIYGHNQFVNLSSEEVEALHNLYAARADEIIDVLSAAGSYDEFIQDLAPVVERHAGQLQDYLSTIRDAALLLTPGEKGPVACAEYSPELQLRLLGIEVSELEEPILDIGCGEHGHLVQHLREQGYQAFGVDRTVTDSPHLIQSDWSQLPVASETWGTVISHMAFSNHFIHHHMRTDGQPEIYARLYMSILRSLQPGGSFYYTPGLPFIEELLPPEQYRVTRIQEEGQKEFYSTRVERL
jgi:SAM-dependent methyltransferase